MRRKKRKKENSEYACMFFVGKKDVYTCVLVCA